MHQAQMHQYLTLCNKGKTQGYELWLSKEEFVMYQKRFYFPELIMSGIGCPLNKREFVTLKPGMKLNLAINNCGFAEYWQGMCPRWEQGVDSAYAYLLPSSVFKLSFFSTDASFSGMPPSYAYDADRAEEQRRHHDMMPYIDDSPSSSPHLSSKSRGSRDTLSSGSLESTKSVSPFYSLEAWNQHGVCVRVRLTLGHEHGKEDWVTCDRDTC